MLLLGKLVKLLVLPAYCQLYIPTKITVTSMLLPATSHCVIADVI